MEDNEVHFAIVENEDNTHKGYDLTTLAQAEENLESVKQAYNSSSAGSSHARVRLKNGTLKKDEGGKFIMDNRNYKEGLRFKLLTNSKSGKEVPKEDCLLALAYAAEHDDVEVVQELVQYAGQGILKARMSFAYSGTILHVCTNWNSLSTLEKVLTGYPPESVDVCLIDRDGDTALHNLPNYWRVPKTYDGCYKAACLLLAFARQVNALDKLLGTGNDNQCTALSKALLYGMPRVGEALLDAVKPMEEKEGQPTRESAARAGPHWLTMTARGYRVAALYDSDDDHEEEEDHNAAFCTALHLAVLKGYGDIVMKILAHPRAQELNLTSLLDHNHNTSLHVAARLGDLKICSMLLKHAAETNKDGGSVQSQNKDGETPLLIASTHGHAGVCETLLEYGASLSVQDKHGRFALTNAFAKGHDEVVKKLLDACLSAAESASGTSAENAERSRLLAKTKGRQSINARFEFGLTPLHVAVAMSSSIYIQKLMDAGAIVDRTDDDDRTPLHVSAQQSDGITALRLLLKAKEERNKMLHGVRHWINMKDIGGQTALHNLVVRLSTKDKRSKKRATSDEESSESSNKEEIRIDGEIRAEETHTETNEPSIEADTMRSMVLELLEAGARVDVEDVNGETPLHVAARYQYEVLSFLLSEATHPHNFRSGLVDNDRNKWICMCDFAGQTALHEAAQAGCVRSISLLLEKTKSPDDLLRVRDMENMTALDWAATRHPNKAELIKKMMTTTVINSITKGFLMWSLKNHVEPHVSAKYCLEYEAKESQSSLLQAAIENEDMDIARELVNRGTDVTALDYDAQRWLAQNLGKASSDQPTSEDTLGRRKLVQGVATLLLNPYTETPITIGVFGSWGAGKSSFMLQVEEAMLSMVVKETFRMTPYSPTLDEVSSLTKFSKRGLHRRAMVVNALKHCMRKTNKFKQDALKKGYDIIENFSVELQSTNRPLFRSLALTDRSKLVKLPTQAWYKRKIPDDAHFIAYTPAVLTLHYNAWQYDNKNEASAGLALEISKQLESFMTPQQWLRMCWKYSWKSRPKEILAHLIFPIFLGIVAAFVALMLWKFVPIATRYKALSLPIGFVGVMGATFKTCLEAIQPVTWTMLNLTKSFDHKSMLGYQHQVIDDIKFLKDQLCEGAHFGWIIISFLSQLFISNTYFIEGTWIWRQYPSLNNFRIVVFIDDLDRCDEKSILELLRAINLILGSCGINVVIGVDKEMLQRAIIRDFLKESSDNTLDVWMDDRVSYEEKNPQILDNVDGKAAIEKKDSQKMANYRKHVKSDKYSYTFEFADRYMQKIIQLPIQIPDPSTKRLEQFLEAQVGQRFTRRDKEKEKLVMNIEDSLSQKSVEVVINKEGVKDKEDSQSQHELENGTSEPVVFRLLLANYTSLEKDMLKHLCQFTTKERKIPREWKRFLTYHRLAWTILSHDRNMKSKEFKGWQRKLILWIFICWNWRPQMDVIFKNWHDITSKSSKWQSQMRLQDKKINNGINLELCDIISTYLESMKFKVTQDTDKNIEKQGEEMTSLAWIDLQNVLKDERDIPMHFIEKFQQFRFYCVLNHLEISESFKPKKIAILNSTTSIRTKLSLRR